MKSEKAKILIIADGYPSEKNLTCGIFVKQQVDSLKSVCQNFEFDIFYNPFFRIFNDPINKKGMFWTALKWLMQFICFIPFLFRQYDMVHAHRFSLPAINGVTYKKLYRVPLIISSHSIGQVEKRYNSRWMKRLFHNCDLIIAMNYQMRQDFIASFQLSPEKVIIRSCGIDFKEFDKKLSQKSVKKADQDTYVLGFVGDFSDNKRPLMFIEAMNELKDRYSIKGVMIGGGSLFGDAAKMIDENEIPITLCGPLAHSELIKYYADFDLFIFPSASETFGIVGVEALYSGVPVISSAVGGKIDYIKDGVNGYLFEKDNFEDMISKITYCLEHTDKMNILKRNARSSVMSYSNDSIAQEICSMYQKTLLEK